MKKKLITVAGIMLAGCSSPPPPPPVNWSGSAVEINSTIPDWKENHVVIPSPVIAGHWAKAMYDFEGEKGNYLPDDYFAVTHANQIVVLSQTSEGYFNAKNWLRAQKGSLTIRSSRDVSDAVKPTFIFIALINRLTFLLFRQRNTLSGCGQLKIPSRIIRH